MAVRTSFMTMLSGCTPSTSQARLVPIPKPNRALPRTCRRIGGFKTHRFCEERKLSREDITVVLENLDKQGYHLQMPPAEDEYIEHLPEELLRRNDPM